MEGARGSSADATRNGPPPEPIPTAFLDPIPDIVATWTKSWLYESPTSTKFPLFCKILIFRKTSVTLPKSGPKRAKLALRRMRFFAVHMIGAAARGKLANGLLVSSVFFQELAVFGGV